MSPASVPNPCPLASTLQTEVMAMGQAMYSQPGAQAGAGPQAGAGAGPSASGASGAKPDDVIDAEFTDKN